MTGDEREKLARARRERRAVHRYKRLTTKPEPLTWKGRAERPQAMERWLLAIMQTKPSFGVRSLKLAVAYSMSFDANGLRGCFKLNQALAEMAGLSVSNMRDGKRELMDCGFIFQSVENQRVHTFPSLPKEVDLDDGIPF